ncbi:YaaL family protein [Paenibacillus pasadenensis]|uniref:YaaL family protein n=1 Tax=Paenibacillus TaxID=44249 RepID=UPI0003FA09DE|nr:YaaL family protein [Paenibacillus pasadenensis]
MGARLFQGRRVEALALSVESEQPAEISLDRLLDEIREAHRDWVNAQYHFEQATGQDQIDYAVFAIEAAQKRYEMLLRQAKRIGAVSPAWMKGGMPG